MLRIFDNRIGLVLWIRLFLFIAMFVLSENVSAQVPIDRKAVVSRHQIKIEKFDSLSSLSVGNGNFAYTVDATGMQSFPELYASGVPLCTQSTWAWHSFPNDQQLTLEETLKEYVFNGKKVKYSVQGFGHERNNLAVDYYRSNPHRLQLGNIGLEFSGEKGESMPISTFKNIDQVLDLWTGVITSRYWVGNKPIKVITVAHPDQDLVSFHIKSPLLSEGKIKIRIRLPAPTGLWKDVGTNWLPYSNQKSSSLNTDNSAVIRHHLDTTTNYIQLKWKGVARWSEKQLNYFNLQPVAGEHFELSVRFVPVETNKVLPTFQQTHQASINQWKKFWMSGGAVDLSGSKDARAFELERRIILSQYLTRIQCASTVPPQETGLTFNSWFGRPHLEMHWWHAVHFALWGRPELVQKSLDWYSSALPHAKLLAQRQGYRGVRWQKMTDPFGHETPSSVGAFLIWQQPHVIYMCELMFKLNPTKTILNKYKELVFATATFMAEYLAWDSLNQNYRLGPGLIPAQESHDPMTTINPGFELAYWRWALTIAQEWRIRSGLNKNNDWEEKLNHLAPLANKDGVYLAAQSAPDSYIKEKYLSDHPAILAAYAGLPPSNYLDSTIMNNTLELIIKKWNWQSTWGWDYPLIAMAATRLNEPETAINALLMPTQKNTYLINGHNYQDSRLTIYLPGNGGLLAAIAMMCAGADQQLPTNPGFPDNGLWQVRWEKLNKIF